ncbi:type I DNA topoisomerase [Brockia lithotrophica]|uniref:DNA topoisomerase 1 n=1 Tax=Brockia lithotrophica TaxID=933949 RepID=A0A660KWW3_9BACL|nr:type I DNA topoisomerase [Brockia lithotrophica]RKQ84181.1 DNA topoisomerase-1 [Brockia lithotrophica]
MGEALVIVESPAKAKTIAKFLGRGVRVVASMGHVRDLPKSQLGVDIENGFTPKYITIRGKGQVLKELKERAKKAEKIYLASDPDREGEAIAWHLAQYLGLDPNSPIRVVFHEITKPAVQASFREPRAIDQRLVDAQQARRILDRLVGYKLSPLLWQKVKRGLSAGRVQSAALKLVVDREREIEAFVPEEYWTLTAYLRAGEGEFSAEFVGFGEDKVPLRSREDVDAVLRKLEGAEFVVAAVETKPRRRSAPPPFTTSTLQQEASKRLGFRPARTMRVAQELYEGLPVGDEGPVGLITYMRTDSTRLSPLAVEAGQAFIRETYGSEYVGQVSAGKKRENVQDAHEAIRPTDVRRTPEAVKPYLSRDQYRLYKLIWERFVASLMAPAVYNATSATLAAGEARFRASGSVLVFPGFLRVYADVKEDAAEKEREEERSLPPLAAGERLELLRFEPKQHFTQPPARYTEAQLVKAMEELGIGRPSTYAPTLETLTKRRYVVLEDRRLRPTELGRLVTELLEGHFPEIVDVGFTANLESQLDQIEEGKLPWRRVLEEFYAWFSERLREAERTIARVELAPQYAGENCPVCGRPLVIKEGRYGPFLACSGYPECTYTRPLLKSLDIPCPKCKQGVLVERRSRKGRVFYGCSRYPECDFVVWQKPDPTPCPVCGGLLVIERNGRLRCTSCGATFTREELERGKAPEVESPERPLISEGAHTDEAREALSAGSPEGRKGSAKRKG